MIILCFTSEEETFTGLGRHTRVSKIMTACVNTIIVNSNGNC